MIQYNPQLVEEHEKEDLLEQFNSLTKPFKEVENAENFLPQDNTLWFNLTQDFTVNNLAIWNKEYIGRKGPILIKDSQFGLILFSKTEYGLYRLNDLDFGG